MRYTKIERLNMLHYTQDILLVRSNLDGTTSSVCPSSQAEPSARNLFHRQRHLYSGDSHVPGVHRLSSTWRARAAYRASALGRTADVGCAGGVAGIHRQAYSV